MKKLKIIIFIFLIFYGVYFFFPYFIKVKINPIPTSTLIYDKNNIEIWEIVTDGKYRHRNTDFQNFPEFLKQSFIWIEDQRFYFHNWIDYIWIVRALKNNIFWWNTQWASTIENQIIRNQYWLNEKRGYKLKIKEFIFSLALNKKYSKDEILSLYLNTIHFWYLNFWVESAAKFYYHKNLENLTQAEIIWLLTIIKNPNNFNPITKLSAFNSRFKILVSALEKKWIISQKEKDLILEEKLTFYTWEKNTLPYIVDFINNSSLKNTQNNGKIFTTLDYYLTQHIDNLAKTTLKNLAWKNVGDYSIIIIDKNTMNLEVMIGWQDYDAQDWQVNASLALRQPGSTLKPFLYALYFQIFWKTPSSTILDLPVSYKTNFWNSYEPKNYSLSYAWEVSLAEALSQSINIPAVKILNEIWIENFLHFLKNIWINSLNRDADYYGLSLALWSWEISLYELTRAYSIFAKNWEYCDINIVAWKDVFSDFQSSKTQPIWFSNWDSNNFQNENLKSTSWCKALINRKYTDMVGEILTNRYFKLAWFPINSNLDFPDREVFVKTGTSRNFKDNWSIWFTSNYIIWVWVWNKSGEEMKWVSGATGAWDIFKKIVYELDNYEKSSPIISLENEKKDFIKIISPLENTIYKIDPSIPIKNQQMKLNFSSNFDYDEIVWYVNWEKYPSNFVSLSDIWKKTSIKIEAYKHHVLLWSDEINIYLQN